MKGSHSVEVIYFAQFRGDVNNIQLDPADHSEYRWFSEAELQELPDDDETRATRRGFALLRGERLRG